MNNIINSIIEELENEGNYEINIQFELSDDESNEELIQLIEESNDEPTESTESNEESNEEPNDEPDEPNDESIEEPNSEDIPDLISQDELIDEMILTGNYYDYLRFLSNTNYLIYCNEDILRHIEERTIPYISQWDNSKEDHYKYMVKMLYEDLFTAEDIFNNIGVYLILKSDSTFIEEDMNIVRKHIINYEINLHAILRPIQNIFNNLLYIQNQNVDLNVEDVKLIVPLDKLAELPIVSYGNINNSLNNSCSFCSEEFTTDTLVRIVKCKHLFHPECIDKWLCEYSYKCPNCREPAGYYKANI